MDWFDVDRKGLAQLLERKGKPFVLFELVQNAWDENTSQVLVTLERIAGTRSVTLRVEDDNPAGFSDLSHAFTLFAESAKKGDSGKRGRFNLGEKLVLALCEEAEIASTKATVRFDASGRHTLRRKTEAGSVFTGKLRMTNEEMAECEQAMRSLIAPERVRTFFNGTLLPSRSPLKELSATLATEVADAEGVLRTAQRKTCVRLYEPLAGESATLYELGIPVVETGGRWHIDVQQKVPLSFDRDNVKPAYLSRVRALALEAMSAELTPEDAHAPWVRDAAQSHPGELSDATVSRLASLRFGEKAVAFDPSDPEANLSAVAQGYTVVHGAQLSKTEWESVRRAGVLLPAGRVTPSPKPYSEDGTPLRFLPEADWSPAMHEVARYVHRVTPALLGCEVSLRVASDVTWPFAATYGARSLTLNLGRLGHKWFEGPLVAINDLLIHEYGHHWSANHLSSEYHDALTRLGARLTQLALEQPELFVVRTRAQALAGSPA